MNNISFYNSFRFLRFELDHDHHTDNTAGLHHHFLARMLAGRAEIETTDGERMQLCAGDVFYLPQGLKYHSYWHVDAIGTGKVMWDSFRFALIPSRTETGFRMKRMCANAQITQLFEAIGERDADVLTVGDFYRLLGLLMPQMEECVADAGMLTVSRAKEYIAMHPDFRVIDLAKHCGVSESGIYELFRQYEQTTPVKMKNRLKAKEAERLLHTTNLSVEEISARLGFCNAGYFRKIIKEQLGMSPREIRRGSELI